MTTSPEASWERRTYREPPIAEAIARIQWATPAAWNIATPGVLFERLKSNYAEEPRAQGILQAGLTQGAPGEAGGIFSVTAGPQKLLYSADDGSRLLGVSAQDVSVHGLKPYEGWESLKHRFDWGVGQVVDCLFDSKAPAVSTIGLRYVNQITIPTEEFRFEDFFTIAFVFPQSFPPTIGSFLDRVELFYPDEPTKLAFTWASTEAGEGQSSFVLDLDYYYQPESPIELPAAQILMEELKVREGKAFESLITEKLRDIFNAE